MTLVEGCYGAAKQLPDDERFGLSAQLRRAAISVPSNIVEGSCRPTRAFVNHVTIALGSLAEKGDLYRNRGASWLPDPGACQAVARPRRGRRTNASRPRSVIEGEYETTSRRANNRSLTTDH